MCGRESFLFFFYFSQDLTHNKLLQFRKSFSNEKGILYVQGYLWLPPQIPSLIGKFFKIGQKDLIFLPLFETL